MMSDDAHDTGLDEEVEWFFPPRLPKATFADGRPRVLWIEDQPKILPQNWRPYRDWLSVVAVKSPRGMRQLLEARQSSSSTKSDETGAALRCAVPPDVYITDFRLCEEVAQGCTEPEHESVGLHAPSVGFLLGVLTALHWPRRPQAIVPYSGWTIEFGQIWRLVKTVCPPTVHVSWDNGVRPESASDASPLPVGVATKGMVDTDQLLRRASARFRDALTVAMNSGTIYMPVSERDRVEQLITTRSETLAASERIVLVGEVGVRSLLVGALFLSEMSDDGSVVPVTAVNAWLRTLPQVDPLTRCARDLSAWFWHVRSLELSEAVYRLIHDREENHRNRQNAEYQPRPIPKDPPPQVDWLFKWMGRRDDRFIRLTLLFLLIREWHASQCAKLRRRVIDDGAYEVYRKLLEVYREREDVRQVAERLQAQAATQNLEPALYRLLESLPELATCLDASEAVYSDVSSVVQSYLFGVLDDDSSPLADATVIRLVDPLPGSYEVPLSLGKSTRWSKQIAQLWSETREISAFRRLLGGDVSILQPSEMIAVRQFTAELMPEGYGFEWPPFAR